MVPDGNFPPECEGHDRYAGQEENAPSLRKSSARRIAHVAPRRGSADNTPRPGRVPNWPDTSNVTQGCGVQCHGQEQLIVVNLQQGAPPPRQTEQARRQIRRQREQRESDEHNMPAPAQRSRRRREPTRRIPVARARNPLCPQFRRAAQCRCKWRSGPRRVVAERVSARSGGVFYLDSIEGSPAWISGGGNWSGMGIKRQNYGTRRRMTTKYGMSHLVCHSERSEESHAL